MITPWSSVATGTVDATGAVTITIPGPLVGTDAQATLSLLDVDNSGNWQCTVLGAPIAFNPTGGVSGIFLQGPNTLVVTATGTDLAEGTLVTASLVGGSAPRGEITPSGPLPFPSSSSVVATNGRGVLGITPAASATVPLTSFTISRSVKAGDTLVLVVTVQNSTVKSVTGGATWTLAKAETNGSYDAEIWVGSAAAGGSTTVTVELNASSDPSACLIECEGSFTVTAVGATGNTNDASPGSVSTAAGNLVFFAVVAAGNSAATTMPTAPVCGFFFAGPLATSNYPILGALLPGAAGGTVTQSFPLAASNPWAAVAAVLAA